MTPDEWHTALRLARIPVIRPATTQRLALTAFGFECSLIEFDWPAPYSRERYLAV